MNDPPFNLNPYAENIPAEEKIRRRAAASALLDVWDMARRRQEERRDVEATQRARGLPHTLPGGDLIAMRRNYESIYGRIDDEAHPPDHVIEKRLQELEQQSRRAPGRHFEGRADRGPVPRHPRQRRLAPHPAGYGRAPGGH